MPGIVSCNDWWMADTVINIMPRNAQQGMITPPPPKPFD